MDSITGIISVLTSCLLHLLRIIHLLSQCIRKKDSDISFKTNQKLEPRVMVQRVK